MASIAHTVNQPQDQQPSATKKNLAAGRYFQCPEVVLHSKLLSWRARCIYEQLLVHAREKDTCFPGHATLARELGVSTDTIQRGLRELRDLGFITWKRRGLTKTNIYTIVELTEVPALKNFLSSKPQSCPDKKQQECGIQKPHMCGTNQNPSNHPQLESDEALSKLGGMVEVTVPTVRPGAPATIRNTEGKKGETPAPSNHHPDAVSPKDPSPLASREESSNIETPPRKETGRPRQSFFKKDEVKAEKPRMSAPPLTQEDMDVRIRERLARERSRTSMHNPLPGIIPDKDWNKLEQDQPTRPLTCKGRPMPVSPRLQQALERISEELGDSRHMRSNITQADNIRVLANVSLEQVLDVLPEAYHATRVAVQQGRITKRDTSGSLVKMPYFFECLRQKLGLSKPRLVCS